MSSTATDSPAPRRGVGNRVVESTPVALVRAAHPRQALVTAAGLAAVAYAFGRPPSQAALVLATVLTGQVLIGWHNDLADRVADRKRPAKPVGQGHVEPSTVWFALACAVLLVVPLSVANGINAAIAYLLSIAVALVGNLRVVRRTAFSPLPWAVAFALYPAFLSYGGLGGGYVGFPPSYGLTALSALLGGCVHFLLALPDLVGDNAQGMRHLPLRIALRIGAPRLLALTVLVSLAAVGGLVAVGLTSGLRL